MSQTKRNNQGEWWKRERETRADLTITVDPKTSAPLFCAGVTAYHGIADCELPAGSWIAVIGCGGLGHMGIQYAKAMGHKVIGVDITDAAIEEAKNCGADYTFNSMTDPDYQKKIVELTGGGVHAAVNFTSSKKSYDDCPAIVKPAEGLIMVVGIPQKPLEFNGLDIALGRYRVKGASNGSKSSPDPYVLSQTPQRN